MDLATKDLKFSDELKGILKMKPTKVYGRSATTEKGRNQEQKDSFISPSKYIERTFEEEKRLGTTSRKRKNGESPQKWSRVGIKLTAFSNTNRTVGANTSARSLNRTRPEAKTVSPGSNQRLFTKTQYVKKHKKVWVPSGIVHYANEISHRKLIFK
eukprot:TRINITY_DN8556_c0_g1_i1.p1 TRINITY_DN8556_c0_g1~~TRINITY_DN8556_c0_g1_i1.p1  ORF type:complete len:156 (-),score=20.58 TRINITY_DN8556_c0_g1_i1:15-482(-)